MSLTMISQMTNASLQMCTAIFHTTGALNLRKINISVRIILMS